MSPSEQIPEGMVEVTVEQFYTALKSTRRDIMPGIVSEWSDFDGYRMDWRDQDGGRQLFGVSQSGNGIGRNRWYALPAQRAIGSNEHD